MTTLNLYGSTIASTTLPTANTLATGTGGTQTNTTTLVGTSSGYGELYSQGNAGAWGAATSIGAPSGHGWLLDATTLEGQQIIAGTWTPSIWLATSLSSITADVIVQAFVYNGGVYTMIGSWTVTAQAIGTTGAVRSPVAASEPTTDFNTGDKLYLHAWLNITTASGNAATTVNVRMSSTSTGINNYVELDTPGYQPQPSAPGYTVPKDNFVGYTQYVGNTFVMPAQTITDMKGIGPGTWVRYQEKWTHDEVTLGSYTFTNLDTAVSLCNQAGVQILIQIQSPPTFRTRLDGCGGTCTLKSALSSGTPYTSFNISALPAGAYYPTGVTVSLNYGGGTAEVVTLAAPTGGAKYYGAGATSFNIVSHTMTNNHAIGEQIYEATGGPQYANAADFANFMQIVARRYNGQGSHGTANAFQVENENYDSAANRIGAQVTTTNWDGSSTWDNGGAIFAAVYNACRPAIQSVYPGVNVAATSVRRTANTSQVSGMSPCIQHVQNWCQGFAQNCTVPCDWFDFHFYKGSDPDFDGSLIGNPTLDTFFDAAHTQVNSPSIQRQLSIMQTALSASSQAPMMMCGEFGWDLYDDGTGIPFNIPVAVSTASGTLAKLYCDDGTGFTTTTTAARNNGGGPYTTLAVTAGSSGGSYPSGLPVYIDNNNATNFEVFYLFGSQAKNLATYQITTDSTGATQVGWNPAHNHASGVQVYFAGNGLSHGINNAEGLWIDTGSGNVEQVYTFGNAALGATTINITTDARGNGTAGHAVSQVKWTVQHSHSSGMNCYGQTTTDTYDPNTVADYFTGLVNAMCAVGGKAMCFTMTNDAVVTSAPPYPATSTAIKSITQNIGGTHTQLAPYQSLVNAVCASGGGGGVTATGTYQVMVNRATAFVEAGTLLMNNSIGRRSQLQCTVLEPATTTTQIVKSFVPRLFGGTLVSSSAVVVSVTALPASSHYQQFQQVQVFDGAANVVFSGYISQPVEQKPGFGASLEVKIVAIDQHFLADKRIVFTVYRNKTCGFMVNDMLTNILAAEGVSVGQIAPGPVVPFANFGYVTVAAALDAIVAAASSSGVNYFWMIDQNKAIWFVPYTAIPGPTLDGTTIDDGRASGFIPRVTRANPKFRTTQYVTGGVAQTGTLTEIHAGDGNTRSFTMGFAVASAPTISINTGGGYVSQTVGTKGQTGFQWYYAVGDPIITQDNSGTVLTTTGLLKVVYTGQIPTVFTASNAAAITAQQQIDGTSGIIESVLNDNTITTSADGLARANQQLTQYGVAGQLFEFATRQTGLAAGQLITVSYAPLNFASTPMLIEQLDISDQQDGYNLWFTVHAIAGPYDVGWVNFFTNLLQPATIANSINLGTTLNVPLDPSTTLYPATTLFPS